MSDNTTTPESPTLISPKTKVRVLATMLDLIFQA
jgi:hypothetical protein